MRKAGVLPYQVRCNFPPTVMVLTLNVVAPCGSNVRRVLSFDGGGVRGLASLMILREIMETIKHKEGLQETPRPCQYFDLICGTSTGGLIALMLGRLGMVF